MTEYLFSYGTLQPGLAPAEIAPVVQKLHRVGRAYVRGVLYDLGSYPGLVLGESGMKVWGQVFALPADAVALRQLDEYEEFDPSDPARSQFIRTRCLSVLESGREVATWIYVYNRDPGTAPVIANGDFTKSRR